MIFFKHITSLFQIRFAHWFSLHKTWTFRGCIKVTKGVFCHESFSKGFGVELHHDLKLKTSRAKMLILDKCVSLLTFNAQNVRRYKIQVFKNCQTHKERHGRSEKLWEFWAHSWKCTCSSAQPSVCTSKYLFLAKTGCPSKSFTGSTVPRVPNGSIPLQFPTWLEV